MINIISNMWNINSHSSQNNFWTWSFQILYILYIMYAFIMYHLFHNNLNLANLEWDWFVICFLTQRVKGVNKCRKHTHTGLLTLRQRLIRGMWIVWLQASVSMRTQKNRLQDNTLLYSQNPCGFLWYMNAVWQHSPFLVCF